MLLPPVVTVQMAFIILNKMIQTFAVCNQSLVQIANVPFQPNCQTTVLFKAAMKGMRRVCAL